MLASRASSFMPGRWRGRGHTGLGVLEDRPMTIGSRHALAFDGLQARQCRFDAVGALQAFGEQFARTFERRLHVPNSRPARSQAAQSRPGGVSPPMTPAPITWTWRMACSARCRSSGSCRKNTWMGCGRGLREGPRVPVAQARAGGPLAEVSMRANGAGSAAALGRGLLRTSGARIWRAGRVLVAHAVRRCAAPAAGAGSARGRARPAARAR